MLHQLSEITGRDSRCVLEPEPWIQRHRVWIQSVDFYTRKSVSTPYIRTMCVACQWVVEYQNVFGSAPNQSCYQPSAGGLLELVLRPNLSILAPGYLGTPPKARDDLAENSRNFAFYESALLRKLDSTDVLYGCTVRDTNTERQSQRINRYRSGTSPYHLIMSEARI
jgi:hypothetical protein